MSIALAHAPAAAPADISAEALRAAWQRARKSDWPATFEEVMQDVCLSRLVVMTARHPERAPLRIVRHPWPFMAARALRSIPPAATAPAVIDLKRAAAGDRDD